eukprot:8700113-Pyramimonas_sp.AAC.1
MSKLPTMKYEDHPIRGDACIEQAALRPMEAETWTQRGRVHAAGDHPEEVPAAPRMRGRKYIVTSNGEPNRKLEQHHVRERDPS